MERRTAVSHEPEVTIASNEDGAHGKVEVLIDADGYIDEQEWDAGKAADSSFGAGEPDEAAALGSTSERLLPPSPLGRTPSRPRKAEASRTRSLL